jgi:hypothetical protein
MPPQAISTAIEEIESAGTSLRDRDIQNATEECYRFIRLAEAHLDAETNTEEDTADLRRFALDAMRALRRIRGSEDSKAN